MGIGNKYIRNGGLYLYAIWLIAGFGFRFKFVGMLCLHITVVALFKWKQPQTDGMREGSRI